ncbi:MAG TPA: ABC transporter ATP-binding protein [Geminicoccus sp.]|jgi:ATP-binding cassette subfamily B protein|uniref:ABC transporter ATP-binding protein n=1 Tax=Geminicoccus sp. TaxID=2024832 RepID=UPI002E32BEC9|nr:ABC transporter ATP-binding protein [Geminicoccus sp.]HEX2527964.1 ABC transporter ATP-binding protein [Geminicoccus sp.]
MINSAHPFRAVLRFVYRHWLRQGGGVLLVVAGIVGATLAEVLLPLFAGRLVDAVAMVGEIARDEAGRQALWALGAIVLLGLVTLGLRTGAIVAVIGLTLDVMSAIGRDAFYRVQRFSSDWHASHFAGSTVRKVSRGMNAIDALHDTLLLALLPSLVVLAGSAALLGWKWPLMGLVVALSALGYLALTAGLSLLWVAPAARLSNSWDTRLGGALADAVGANAVVKSFGAEAREDELLGRLITRWRKRTRRFWLRGTASEAAQGGALQLLRAAVIGMALWFWWQGQATPGDVAYVLTMYLVVQGYLRDVGYHVHALQRSVNEMEELVSIHEQPLGIDDHPQAKPIRIAHGEIRFDHVHFHYGRHTVPLYHDLSVTIRAGQRVGLVGRSGSGKTTFVKLIQRLHDVNDGRILIDGQEITQASQTSLRAQIAVVQQEPILFHRSLFENIAYARQSSERPVAMAEVEQAARLANAHEFITRLPKGYATTVGERGVKLSGGERQRVALARAFFADAPILILDEATSSLDSESEALVQEAMERLMKGRTSIVIAHRLSTVRAVDRILVFDGGRIVEDGPHDLLLRKEDGIYRRLFDRQARGMLEAA